MRIMFLGDIVGVSGCNAIHKNLNECIKKNNIDFIVANGENASNDGVGITKEIADSLFDIGIDVITTGNHIWDQKETAEFIEQEPRLLRPQNLLFPSPGNGFGIYIKKNYKIGVLNLMGNVFMKKSEDVFKTALEFQKKNILKKDFDFLIIDFHGEITSEKMALGHLFDGKATLVVGTHTHVPTSDTRILEKGTAYQTDAGMCGDYNSVIGMDKNNSLNRFLKKESVKHFPANGEGTLSGVIVEANENNGLANHVKNFIFGGALKS
ncbi:MAG: metallophosphoesterase [Candidatus Pelagibacter sp. TMED273]|nr:MAG: metallophosphoesterase [Candidatus Pelagibacter sp. TMED273]